MTPAPPASADHETLVHFVGRTTLFGGLGKRDLEHLARFVRVRQFRDGESIYEEGRPGAVLFRVRTGRVEITKRMADGSTLAVASLDPPASFEELAAIGGEVARWTSARARGAVELLALGRADLESLSRQNPSAANKVIVSLAEATARRLHQLVGREADATVARAARFLALTPEEDRLLVTQGSLDARWERLRRQHFEDEALLERRGLRDPARASTDSADSTDAWAGSMAASVPVLAQLMPAWVPAFFPLAFLLADDGRIKRDLFALVPNRYFEPVLSIHADLHATLQSYAKALFTQCALLGFTVALALAIAGIPPRWALVIGFFAGMANVVPYAGIGTALAGGMLYALLGYEAHPLMPFVNAENLPWAVLAAVLATDAIKNAVYDPLVFGGALELHPVTVILGVAAGATIFGFLGALFAVPALAFGRALVGSVFRQLRSYGAI